MIKLLSGEGIAEHLKQYVDPSKIEELTVLTRQLMHSEEELKFCNSCNLAGYLVELFPE